MRSKAQVSQTLLNLISKRQHKDKFELVLQRSVIALVLSGMFCRNIIPQGPKMAKLIREDPGLLLWDPSHVLRYVHSYQSWPASFAPLGSFIRVSAAIYPCRISSAPRVPHIEHMALDKISARSPSCRGNVARCPHPQ